MKILISLLLLTPSLLAQGAKTPEELFSKFTKAFEAKQFEKISPLFLSVDTPKFIISENTRTIKHQFQFKIVSSKKSELSKKEKKRISKGLAIRSLHPSILKTEITPKDATHLYPNIPIEGVFEYVLHTPVKEIKMRLQYGQVKGVYLFSLCRYGKL